MRLGEALRDSCILVGATFQNKDETLGEIARLVALELGSEVVTADTILDGFKRREELCSSGIGKGLALPHCRLEEVSEFVVGAFTVPEGVDFEALDGEPVHLIVFIVGPETGRNEHIHLISTISHACDEKDEMSTLLAQQNASTLKETLLRFSGDEIEAVHGTRRDLFHVFVRENEDLFLELLEVFAAADAASVTVIDAHESTTYLTQLPLFAGLFADEAARFNRLIVAVVDRALTNEFLRRIQGRTGPLAESHEVMVTVQQLYYAAGSLGG